MAPMKQPTAPSRRAKLGEFAECRLATKVMKKPKVPPNKRKNFIGERRSSRFQANLWEGSGKDGFEDIFFEITGDIGSSAEEEGGEFSIEDKLPKFATVAEFVEVGKDDVGAGGVIGEVVGAFDQFGIISGVDDDHATGGEEGIESLDEGGAIGLAGGVDSWDVDVERLVGSEGGKIGNGSGARDAEGFAKNREGVARVRTVEVEFEDDALALSDEDIAGEPFTKSGGFPDAWTSDKGDAGAEWAPRNGLEFAPELDADFGEGAEGGNFFEFWPIGLRLDAGGDLGGESAGAEESSEASGQDF